MAWEPAPRNPLRKEGSEPMQRGTTRRTCAKELHSHSSPFPALLRGRGCSSRQTGSDFGHKKQRESKRGSERARARAERETRGEERQGEESEYCCRNSANIILAPKFEGEAAQLTHPGTRWRRHAARQDQSSSSATRPASRADPFVGPSKARYGVSYSAPTLKR